jgi:hypothetical protein
MDGVHAAIGAGEALITAVVLATVMRLRPDIADRARSSLGRDRPGGIAVLGLVAAAALGLFVSPFACAWPDGLERVVERLGVEPSRAILSAPAPLRGYAIPGLHAGVPSTSLAALAGTLLVFACCVAVGVWLAPRRAAGRATGGPDIAPPSRS